MEYKALSVSSKLKCTTCSGPMKSSDEALSESATRLDCGHWFHLQCIKRWFENQIWRCPICANRYTTLSVAISQSPGKSILPSRLNKESSGYKKLSKS